MCGERWRLTLDLTERERNEISFSSPEERTNERQEGEGGRAHSTSNNPVGTHRKRDRGTSRFERNRSRRYWLTSPKSEKKSLRDRLLWFEGTKESDPESAEGKGEESDETEVFRPNDDSLSPLPPSLFFDSSSGMSSSIQSL